jgi:hypothetical protein
MADRQADDRQWWPEWAENFALIFGLATDKDMQMLALWEELFRPYTQDEMDAATRRVAQSGERLYKKADMLAALQQALNSQRIENDLRRRRPSEGRTLCGICGDSGYVVVPNLRAVDEGVWTHQTAGGFPCHTTAVLCGCGLGKHRAGTGASQMTLAEYEANNPEWRVQMFEWQQGIKAEAQAHTAASSADGCEFTSGLDKLFDRLKKLVDERMSL